MLATGRQRWTITDGEEFVLAVNSQTASVVTAAPRPGVQPWTTEHREYAEQVAADLREEWPYFRVEAA